MLGVLLFAAAGTLAHADDYADVNQLLRQGKATEALAKADAYIVGKPRDPQMRFLRGVILSEQGKTADATTAFVQLTQDFPELPEPYNNLAALYAQQSKFDLARDALENAIRLNPNYATAHENLGDVYARLAAQSYAKAQQLASTNASAAPKLALIRQIFTGTPASISALPAAPVEARKQTHTK
ncbi:tetratricopeptide repeat protein [Variovorax sp. ZT4R33]|uniref:tetratricopeptide repeat protein n=1 Tax=Variovorax sp. ZT4R33 TaxID=3443743 RepID=UPI003F48D9BA